MSTVADPKRKKRSPLKERPLRGVGQSVDDQISDVLDDGLSYLIPVLFLGVLTALEWWRYLRRDTLHPWTYTVMFLVLTAFVSRAVWKRLAKVRLLKLGRDGERIVGEFLDQLRPHGYTILHDILGGNFNVDHVLIGPTGVFVIETKTLSKSGGQEEKIQFDGTNVIIHGYPVDPNPVVQAKANARWLRELLKNSTGKDFPVTPVVLYPGWYVERKTNANDTLVLNPKNLESALKSRSAILPSTDASLTSFHLKAFIRSK